MRRAHGWAAGVRSGTVSGLMGGVRSAGGRRVRTGGKQ